MKVITLSVTINVLLCCFSVFGQNIPSDHYLDSLQYVIEQATSKSEKAEGLFLKGEYLVQRNPPLAEKISNQIEKGFISEKDSIKIIRNKYIYAASQRWQGNYQTALKNYELILSYSLRHSDSTNIARSSHFIGSLHMFLGNNTYSQKHLLNAAKIYDVIGTPRERARISNTLGGFYLNINQLKKGEKKYLDALTQFEILKDTAGMANTSANLGIVYVEQGNYEKAEKFLLKQKTFNYVFPTLREMGFHHDFMGVLRQKQGRLHQAYQEHLRALRIREKLSSSYNLCESKLNMGSVLIRLNRFDEAIIHLEEVLNFKEHQSLFQQQTAHEKLSEAFENKKKFKEALQHFKSYKKITDSIYTKESLEIITEKDALYNQEKKEAEIKLLNTENEIVQLKLSKSQDILTFAYVGVLFLIGVAFLLYSLYLKIKKQNKIISKELRNRELLIREVHHRVKNSLQRISSLLHLQSKYLGNPDSIEALLKSRSRVQSMALIHENLYQGSDLTRIDLNFYFENLIKSIVDSYKMDIENINYVIDADDIKLDIEPTISLGLIANELITNSLKHAFTSKIKNPVISVEMKKQHKTFKLIVSDNGVGIENNSQECGFVDGFGKKLIELLVNKMESQISFKHINGTKVIIEIPQNILSQHFIKPD